MKKTYIIPAMQPMNMEAERIVAGSITKIDGDSGIGLADENDPIPGTADVNVNPFGDSIFD